MSVPLHPTDALILAIAATGRDTTDAELAEIAAHIASRGFNPAHTRKVDRRVAGVQWQGCTYQRGEIVSNELYHFLAHVIEQQEWPTGTIPAEYVQSLRAVILDPDAGTHVSRISGEWQLNIFAPVPEQWRGPNGQAYSVVGYRPALGWWLTGFRIPLIPLDYVATKTDWQDARWLRLPQQ